MPTYNEIANIPFFLWDPRAQTMGEHRKSLAQNIDVAATLVDFFGQPIPPDMQGKPLLPIAMDDTPIHDTVLFGYHGGMTCVTDGRYIYMRGPATRANAPLYEYTLIPARMGSRMDVKALQDLELAPPFRFTKGCKTLKIDASGHGSPFGNMYRFGNRLYDLADDPGQKTPIRDDAAELRLIGDMLAWMRDTDAPAEQYERLGLRDGMTPGDLAAERDAFDVAFLPGILPQYEWTREAASMYFTLISLLRGADIAAPLGDWLAAHGVHTIEPAHITAFARETLPPQQAGMALMMMGMSRRLD